MNPYEAPTTTASKQPPLRETAPRSPGNPGAVKAWAWGVVFVTLLVNAFLLFSVRASGDGWGGLAVVFFLGPIANATIMLLSLSLYFVVRIHAQGASMYYYGQACIGAPLLAMIVDGIAISMMDLRGGC
jgi:hypothetical protein